MRKPLPSLLFVTSTCSYSTIYTIASSSQQPANNQLGLMFGQGHVSVDQGRYWRMAQWASYRVRLRAEERHQTTIQEGETNIAALNLALERADMINIKHVKMINVIKQFQKLMNLFSQRTIWTGLLSNETLFVLTSESSSTIVTFSRREKEPLVVPVKRLSKYKHQLQRL